MLRRILLCIILFSLGIETAVAYTFYGERFCDSPGFRCRTLHSGESFASMFPDPNQRDIVMRLNRMNMAYPGTPIAIPRNLKRLTIFDISPFPLKMAATGEKVIRADLSVLAWGAYDKDGYLVYWGPLSSGKGFCEDEGEACHTPTGVYNIFAKEGYNCISKKFPIPDGGAAMPFCMYYTGGFALHGSFEVPGFNASHGCIRMFITDARWLNQEFVNIGTKVIVRV